jgi:hypothetical protein
MPDGEADRAQQLQARAEQVRGIGVAEPAADETVQPLRPGGPDCPDQDLQRAENEVGEGRRRHRRVLLGAQEPDPVARVPRRPATRHA